MELINKIREFQLLNVGPYNFRVFTVINRNSNSSSSSCENSFMAY